MQTARQNCGCRNWFNLVSENSRHFSIFIKIQTYDLHISYHCLCTHFIKIVIIIYYQKVKIMMILISLESVLILNYLSHKIYLRFI